MDEHATEFLVLGMLSSTARKIQRVGVDEYAAETAEMFPDAEFGEQERTRLTAVTEILTEVEFVCSGGEAAEKAIERKMQDYISRAFENKK
ncbi:MAG: hypothetical protein ISN29_11965 [Gammaproteobacteria bacterium AqS3]|nr:hypothetical protein [Gammaproteobacteria bacterium AqS3]